MTESITPISMWHHRRRLHPGKSVCQTSALLELPQAIVSEVIVKWKRLRASAVQLRSDRPCRERDHQVLKHVVRKSHKFPTGILTTEFQTAFVHGLFVRSLITLDFMGKQPHASLRSPWVVPNACWSVVQLTTIRFWKCILWNDLLHHLAVRRMILALADARRILPAWMWNANRRANFQTSFAFRCCWDEAANAGFPHHILQYWKPKLTSGNPTIHFC